MSSNDDPTVLVTWTHRLARPIIPVRAATIRELESLRAFEDQVDANSLGEVVASDPLMTLRLLTQVSQLRGPKQQGELQTVTASLVWLGIGPFFRSIDQIRSIEQALEGSSAALQQVERRLTFNHRAARLALAFAAERGDPDAALLHHAALLTDLHELLLWVHEPDAALRIESVQEADGFISAEEAQRQVLGVVLADLKQPISQLLRLPRVLDQIHSANHVEHQSVACVEFALRLARRELYHGAADLLLDSHAADKEALMMWLDVSESRLSALISEAGS